MATHGLTNDNRFYIYRGIVKRCTQPTDKDFHRYGGRGITLCDRWLLGEHGKPGILCFFEDIGARPSPAHTIERVDNNAGYNPDNCIWALPKEQGLNRHNNYFPSGVDPQLVCREAGVNYSTFRVRVAKGWSVDRALDPADGRKTARRKG